MTYSHFYWLPRPLAVSIGLCALLCPIFVRAQGSLVVPFGSNKELSPAHQSYQFPYKENYIMLPLTSSTVTNNGEVRVIVNKPIAINNRRTTVIPLNNGGPTVSPQPVVPIGMNGGNVARPIPSSGRVISRTYYTRSSGTVYASTPVQNPTPAPTPVQEYTTETPTITPATPTPYPNSIVTPPEPIESSEIVVQETPSTETPSTETPSTETPSTETPSTETPTIETPSTEPTPENPYIPRNITPTESTTPIDSMDNQESITSSETVTPPATDSSGNYGSDNYGSDNYGSDNYGSDNYGSDNYGNSDKSTPYTPPQSAWRTDDAIQPTHESAQGFNETLYSSPMIMTRPDSRTANSRQDVQFQKPIVKSEMSTETPNSMVPGVENRVTTPKSPSQRFSGNTFMEVRPRRKAVIQQPPVSSPIPEQPQQQPTPQPTLPEEIPTQLPPPEPSVSPLGPPPANGTRV